MTNKEKPCKFCDSLKTAKQIINFLQEHQSTEELRVCGKYKSEYTVAIVKRSWYAKIGKKKAQRTVCYRRRGLGYKLNYCPECGRELKHERQRQRSNRQAE